MTADLGPAATPRPVPSPEDRTSARHARLEVLLAKYARRDGACLRWTGSHSTKGYAQARFDGRTRALHRVVYELGVGPIPEGLEIDHLCHVRDCVELSHLDVVSHRENIHRRRDLHPDRCPHGHEFTPENTMWRRESARPNPIRRCRACKKADNAARPSRARRELNHV